MKTQILGFIAVLLIGSFSVQADKTWNTGHHEIVEGDSYGEIWMYYDATADMFGGEVLKVETFDVNPFNMYGGEMNILRTNNGSIININGGVIETLYIYDDSIINIFSGSFVGLGSVENSSINIYAYDVVHYPTGGSNGNGWMEGRYFSDDLYFSFNLIQEDSFSHINIVPEPISILILGIGGLIVSRRAKKKN